MLKFNVDNQVISRTDEFCAVAGSKNYLTAEFSMTDEWKGAVALFGYGGEYFQVLLDADNRCYVPYEVIKPPFFTVSVFCENVALITSNSISVDVMVSGFESGAAPQEPLPELWEQYVAQMQELVDCGLPYIGVNNNWFVYSTEKKEYVDSGIAALAYTPVKGVDYWTEEDRAEIADEVWSSNANNYVTGEYVDNLVQTAIYDSWGASV